MKQSVTASQLKGGNFLRHANLIIYNHLLIILIYMTLPQQIDYAGCK